MSGLVIVLTLPVNEEEGHRPYLSQSAYPAKGTTVGGRTDDPRRERTRDALARHRARAGAGQRQRGVPRAGDLADRLLSLAQPAGTLRGRRRAPAPAARPGGAPGGDGARSGAAGARDRDQRGHLGLPTDRGLPRPDLAGALGAQHGAAAAAPGRAGHPARATDGARAAGGADGGTADGTYSPTPVARPLRPHAARRGERAGRARVSGHVLHRQPQRRRQSLADHGVRCGHFVRGGRCAASSPMAGPSSRGRLMRAAAGSASGTRAPNRAMPGPTALSNGCRARFSRSTGVWPSVGTTSPVAWPCNGPSTASCATTTPSARTKAIAFAVEPRPLLSGAWWRRDVIHHSGMAKVSTPFRVWTP